MSHNCARQIVPLLLSYCVDITAYCKITMTCSTLFARKLVRAQNLKNKYLINMRESNHPGHSITGYEGHRYNDDFRLFGQLN